MELDDAPRDREAQAEPGAGRFARAAHEGAEDLLQFFRRDAGPLVDAEDLEGAGGRGLRTKFDRAALGRVADGVPQEIVEGARERREVRLEEDVLQRRVDRERHADAALLRFVFGRLADVVQKGPQFDALQGKFFPRVETRDYKENISLKEACVELGFLTAETFDEVFKPEQMV